MRLPRAFYLRDALVVAPDLLGRVLVRVSPEGVTAGRIVETEAYPGFGDAAAHVYRRGRTPTTEVQFGEGGHAYVYLIYGRHACLNIVTNAAERPDTVLIRALEPLAGEALMQARRGSAGARTGLCNGPGKLCAALDITPRMSGQDLCRTDAGPAGPAEDDLYVAADDSRTADFAIERTPRRNIAHAGEAAGFPWRFVIKNSPFASR